jgi:hypothetical protein
MSHCAKNSKSRFTINPPNGIVTRLPTRPFYIEMELELVFVIS